MEDTPRTASKTGKILKLLLMITITAICIWYVSGRIDFAKAGTVLKNANWFYLVPALIAFVISKWVAALRLNIYLKNIGIHLPQAQNRKLYWLGMFYNLFLPGAISGDAYKVVVLSKKYSIPYRKTTAAVLLDRFSGIVGLGLVLTVYGLLVFRDLFYVVLIIAGAISSVVIYYRITKKWFNDFLAGFWPTLFLGIVVQLCQVICAYLIMYSLGITEGHTAYIFLFLVSSVVAILPLTISGLGAREVVFLEGSAYFGFAPERSIMISLIFYVITLFTSVFGLIYVFLDPLKKERTHE